MTLKTNRSWLSFALKFEKDHKLANIDVEKIVPRKENTQCQSRVKIEPFFRPKSLKSHAIWGFTNAYLSANSLKAGFTSINNNKLRNI